MWSSLAALYFLQHLRSQAANARNGPGSRDSHRSNVHSFASFIDSFIDFLQTLQRFAIYKVLAFIPQTVLALEGFLLSL